MGEHRSDIESAGGSLFAIGNGSAAMARNFAEQFEIDFPLYTDPSRKTYQLAGFKRSAAFLGPATLKNGIRARKAGFKQGRLAGDAWQQGGELIVAPGNRLLYCQASSGPGASAAAR